MYIHLKPIVSQCSTGKCLPKVFDKIIAVSKLKYVLKSNKRRSEHLPFSLKAN